MVEMAVYTKGKVGATSTALKENMVTSVVHESSTSTTGNVRWDRSTAALCFFLFWP